MRVEITEQKIFQDISSKGLYRYLAVNGWHEIRRVEGELYILEKTINLEKRQLVWVPINDSYDDYASMVSRVIKTVAETEKKSELQVVDDLQTVAIGDVVRVRTIDPLDERDHTIPLMNGINLLDRTRMMALAAAASAVAVKKQPVYPRRAADQARTFVRKLRLGQTERGSFLVRVISPLIGEYLEEGVTDVAATFKEASGKLPFSRKAMLELITSLNYLKDAAEENKQNDRYRFNSFLESVPFGVSANLCESLVSIDEKTPLGNPIEVSVTWSYLIDHVGERSTKPIYFDPSLFPFIQQAGKEFRARNPEEITLRGWVNILERDAHSGPCLIRVEGHIDGRPHLVRMQLDPLTYDLAIEAHKNRIPVSVKGNLIVEKRVYRLENPSNFHIGGEPTLFDGLE